MLDTIKPELDSLLVPFNCLDHLVNTWSFCFIRLFASTPYAIRYDLLMNPITLLLIGGYCQVDPTTGDAEDDGVDDEYQLEDLEVVAADYVLKVGVSNFRNAWESMGPDYERVDEYGLGARESYLPLPIRLFF